MFDDTPIVVVIVASIMVLVGVFCIVSTNAQAENIDGSMGYNDYIPENSFKNNLSEQGYTVCYDTKPEGVETVVVTYMGLKGDPGAEDVDYVLKSEYDALNASSQDTRINSNQEAIQNNTTYSSDNEIRIKDLESTQYKAQLSLRLYDAQHFSVSTYGQYNIGRQKADEFGVNITLKLTKSYEGKELAKLAARMARLERNEQHEKMIRTDKELNKR